MYWSLTSTKSNRKKLQDLKSFNQLGLPMPLLKEILCACITACIRECVRKTKLWQFKAPQNTNLRWALHQYEVTLTQHGRCLKISSASPYCGSPLEPWQRLERAPDTERHDICIFWLTGPEQYNQNLCNGNNTFNIMTCMSCLKHVVLTFSIGKV